MMPRLWIGNFDFEHRLADPNRTPSATLRRLDAELAPTWLAVAEDGDAIWTPQPVPPEFWEAMAAAGFPRITPVTDWRSQLERYEPTAWGWTPELLAIAITVSPRRELPPANVVRSANSRRWSFARETEWQVGLPHAAACESVDDVARALAAWPAREAKWVVKAEFGMSGRERLLGQGALTAPAINWLRRRLSADGVVFVEPWVERVAEAGILFDVPATGAPQLVGVAEMLPSPQGQYAGSVFAGTLVGWDESSSPTTSAVTSLVGLEDSSHPTSWSSAIEMAHRAAVELQRLGYVGPLGIDAMWYRTADGELRLRPLQDVNARWTMGRLALGWRRFFPNAAFGAWCHTAGGGTSDSGPLAAVFGGEGTKQQVIPTSPDTIGGQPARHRTAVVVHPRG